jgi:hypothetical protein
MQVLGCFPLLTRVPLRRCNLADQYASVDTKVILPLIPSVLERVKIIGRDGVYLAIRVDLTCERADLLPEWPGYPVERGVCLRRWSL